jgi:hypothetical protein
MIVSMLHASEVEPVAPGIWLWRFYDPSVKADLFSTAVAAGPGIYILDPVPLAPGAFANLNAQGTIAGVIVTNGNHERAAASFAHKFRVPIYMDFALASATSLPGARSLTPQFTPAGLTPVTIQGGPVGEMAVHFGGDDGTMVVGDALINFDPYGFALLPPKYCSNFKLMRRSLSTLLDYQFERMLFAHGMPVLGRARQRLEILLKEHR